MKYSEIIKYANESAGNFYTNFLNSSYIVLSNSGMDDFFEAMKGNKVEFENQYGNNNIQLLDNEPNIKFEVKEKGKDDFILTTNIDVFDYSIIPGKNYTYFLQKNKLYKCSKQYDESVLKLINIFKVNFTKEIPFKKGMLYLRLYL